MIGFLIHRNISLIPRIFFLSSLAGCTTLSSPMADYEIRKAFYPDGTLKTVSAYQHGKRNGIERQYSEGGQLKIATTYVDNKVDGFENTYYPDGALWRKELYEGGRVVERMEFDEEGQLASHQDLQ